MGARAPGGANLAPPLPADAAPDDVVEGVVELSKLTYPMSLGMYASSSDIISSQFGSVCVARPLPPCGRRSRVRVLPDSPSVGPRVAAVRLVEVVVHI